MLRDLGACLRTRVFDNPRTSLIGAALLATLMTMHVLGADGIRALAGEVSAVGDLLTALTGAAGVVPGLAGAWLLLWKGGAK